MLSKFVVVWSAKPNHHLAMLPPFLKSKHARFFLVTLHGLFSQLDIGSLCVHLCNILSVSLLFPLVKYKSKGRNWPSVNNNKSVFSSVLYSGKQDRNFYRKEFKSTYYLTTYVFVSHSSEIRGL